MAAQYAPEFERRVDEVKTSKSDLNALVMNYLINEGYQAAAENFAKEANMSPQVNWEEMSDRVKIRHLIFAGDIHNAIIGINDLDQSILDSDKSLHFSLLRLQLIELIKKCCASSSGDVQPAITFAATELAPRATSSEVFLEDLERTMALLCFPHDSLIPELQELLDPALRRSVANRVNEKILEAQGFNKETKIRSLVKLRAWGEDRLRQQHKDLPKLELGIDFTAPVEQDQMMT
ncbi:CTLH/CRA C-terminal to lish motif domain-containing protein [Pyronema omphalodes]|nr:CTLH/CRA C-terminal to lish motif domain-containing protein [Pyronema omphalodes]